MSKARGPIDFQGPSPLIGHNRSLSQNLSQKRQSAGSWQPFIFVDLALHLRMYVARIFLNVCYLKCSPDRTCWDQLASAISALKIDCNISVTMIITFVTLVNIKHGKIALIKKTCTDFDKRSLLSDRTYAYTLLKRECGSTQNICWSNKARQSKW